MRRLLLALAVVAFLDLVLTEPALADNCADLTDCFDTVRDIIITGGVILGGWIGWFWATGGGDLGGDDSGAEGEPPAVEPGDDPVDDPCVR